MFRYAFRRLLWTLPTLIGVSIISFLFLSYVPDPTDDQDAAAGMSAEAFARVRRERFLELPRFVNLAPIDVHQRADAAIAAIVEDGPGAAAARREISRLGGAALPHVLPSLDALKPEHRVRVALALAPLARRMGIGDREEIEDPKRVVAFWTRFWDDRGIEFRRSSVRSAVSRMLRYGGSASADDLRELDTYAFEEVFADLERPSDEASIHRDRTLIGFIADMTGSEDRIATDATRSAATACVERWIHFWNVYRSDFVEFRGPSRVVAMVLDTRYGKWALGAITYRFGRCSSGAPVLDEFAERAPVTLAILFGAILLAYAAGIPLGALAAAHRGRPMDLALACAGLGIFAIPTAFIAIFVVTLTGDGGPRLLLAVIVLALGLVAAPARQERGALTSALGQEHVRAALARGSSRMRALIVHGLRNGLLPVATLASLEAPMALGGAFVVERVFGLHGVGELTIRAVQDRDTSWLMAISIFAAGMAAIFVLLTDIVCVLVDPRLVAITYYRRMRG